MTGAEFGKKSYAFAIGCVKATSHPVLGDEQLRRLREAGGPAALKLLDEYNYGMEASGRPAEERVAAEMRRTSAFLREIAPDLSLLGPLFFEEDARNLKWLLKAKLAGRDAEGRTPAEGRYDPDLLRLCVAAEDFSLLGDALAQDLDGIFEETDPMVLSCRVDAAVYAGALRAAKKGGKLLERLLREYGAGINRLTALRMRALPGAAAGEVLFLPVDWAEFREKDAERTPEEIRADVEDRLDAALAELRGGERFAPLAEYYFSKKREAKKLRLLFAQKQWNETAQKEGAPRGQA